VLAKDFTVEALKSGTGMPDASAKGLNLAAPNQKNTGGETQMSQKSLIDR